MLGTESGDRTDHRSLFSHVLNQNIGSRGGLPRSIGRALLPVHANELLGDLANRQLEGFAIVMPMLDREIREGDHQRELVGGREIALGEQTLELRQERQLRFG
jgi:hypothetical protein